MQADGGEVQQTGDLRQKQKGSSRWASQDRLGRRRVWLGDSEREARHLPSPHAPLGGEQRGQSQTGRGDGQQRCPHASKLSKGGASTACSLPRDTNKAPWTEQIPRGQPALHQDLGKASAGSGGGRPCRPQPGLRHRGRTQLSLVHFTTAQQRWGRCSTLTEAGSPRTLASCHLPPKTRGSPSFLFTAPDRGNRKDWEGSGNKIPITHVQKVHVTSSSSQQRVFSVSVACAITRRPQTSTSHRFNSTVTARAH